MPYYLTCEADLNFPGPTVEQAVAQVRALYRNKVPVTTMAVAMALEGETPGVEDVLRRASHCGLVRHMIGWGWVPLVS